MLTNARPSLNSTPDGLARLVDQALADSSTAFGQLIQHYQHRVLRTIAALIGDEHAVQDVAQETFVSAWHHLDQLKESHKFGAWLTQMAVNRAKSWLRDQAKHRDNTAFLDETTSPGIAQVQRHYFARDQLRQAVWDAIETLPPPQREAVVLHYISGYAYKEIAHMLSLPHSTLVGRLQKARRQLRKEFLDMVAQLQLEIEETLHQSLEARAQRDGVSVEALIVRLIEQHLRGDAQTGLTTRMVWDGADTSGNPSPDGRFLSYVDYVSANLAVHDLHTGENRILTDEGTWDEPDQYPWHSVWSPDGQYLAYCWFNKDGWELRVVDIKGSKARRVYRLNEGQYIEPHAWSANGQSILVQLGRSEWALVSVDQGAVQARAAAARPVQLSLSPDDRYIVYDALRDPEQKLSPRDLFLATTDGRETRVLLSHPANDYGPVWTPDGRFIVFFSDRTGTPGLWALEMAEGQAVGAPRLVYPNMERMLPMSFTRDGTFFYGLGVHHRPIAGDIYLAPIDQEPGMEPTPPTVLPQRYGGYSVAPTWSPDGQQLAYLTLRHLGPGPMGHYALGLHDVETGQGREWPLPYRGDGLCWSPDGRRLMVYNEFNPSLYVVEVDTGQSTVLLEQSGITIHDAAWSPDGQRLFYVRRRLEQEAYPTHVVVRDLESGVEDELYRHDTLTGLALSPDGQQLALIYDRVLALMPATGGEPTELWRLPEAKEQPPQPGRLGETFAWSVGPRWTPDGRHLLIGKRPKDCFPYDQPQEGFEVWRVPVDGSAPQALGVVVNCFNAVSVHPDGRRLAYSQPGHFADGVWEVWMMENLMSRLHQGTD